MQYIGIRGNTYYLMDKNSNEASAFNSLGAAINSCSADLVFIETRGNCFEVDILSILGEQGLGVCEVFFKGKTYTINAPFLDVYAKLNKHLSRYNHIIYSIKHTTKVKQLLIPLLKNSLSDEELKSLLKIK